MKSRRIKSTFDPKIKLEGCDEGHTSTITSKSLLSDCKSNGEHYSRGYFEHKNIFWVFGVTGDEVTKDVDLANKRCLITGASSGIGLQMALALGRRGCELLVACRNPYPCRLVARSFPEDPQRVKAYELNLSSLKSVKACAEKIVQDGRKIDIVILNAAVFGLPWSETEDVLETTFQVNYLSQIYLLMQIEHILAPDARVVFMSSESHRNVKWDAWDRLSPTEQLVSLPKRQYTSIKAYNRSKLCGLLAMQCWSRRWGAGRAFLCAHPGTFLSTNLCRNWWPYELLYYAMKPFSKSLNQAASTPLYCATSPELAGFSSGYFKSCQRCDESELARDLQLAYRVHHLTLDIIRDRTSSTADSGCMPSDVNHAREPVDQRVVSNYS